MVFPVMYLANKIMEAHKHTFNSGLRLITVPMPTLTSATICVWVNVGSRYEAESNAGISHFLEHMAFKGGKKYSNAKMVSETIDAIGAEYNAATSKDWTNFYIKTQTSFLEKAADVLSDMILSPKLDEEDIHRERGVILSEMDMYEDAPMYRINDIFDQLYFKGNTLGRDIIGYKKTVGETIKRADFIEFRKKHYHPQNMLITIAGGVTEEESIKLVSKYFDNVPKGPDKETFTNFNLNQTSPRIRLVEKKIEQAHMIIGFPGFNLGNENRYIESVLSTILGGGMSSRLFTEVREKRGLCYNIRAGSDHFVDCGNFSVYVGTDPNKSVEAIKVILSEIESLKNRVGKITKEELQKAKDYEKGHIALSLENTRTVGSYFGYEELLLERYSSIEEDFKGIDSVTEDQVCLMANEIFDTKKINLAIIGPFEDTKQFEKVLN